MRRIIFTLIAFLFVYSMKMNSQTNNILGNPGFEGVIAPSGTETLYGLNCIAPVRATGFFDALCQTANPNVTATAIPDYAWFERGTSQHQCRLYVDDTKSHSGNYSMAIHNVGYLNSNATATMPWYHNLAQKVSLDDTKKYVFKFWLQRGFTYTRPNDPPATLRPNEINEIYVGIISSTGAVSASNYTYYEKITIPNNEDWNEIAVTFDLPAILSQTANTGKSFESCVVFIAMQTGWDAIAGVTKESKVNVDDMSLTAASLSGIVDLKGAKPPYIIRVIDGKILIKGDFKTMNVYDMLGKKVNKSSLNPGIYIVNVDNECSKILVK